MTAKSSPSILDPNLEVTLAPQRKFDRIYGVDENFGNNRLADFVKRFFTSKIVKTRKDHWCVYCMNKISAGEQCYTIFLVNNGRYSNVWFCLDASACEYKVAVREN